ncbi:MAG: acetamidase/formamidase family protein [Acidobacteriia bacterium]|nr:acetamidase/formamidase family protein [Terriglobia bacterium]
MKRCAAAIFAILLSVSARAGAQSGGKVYELKSSPTTVHRGFYDATLKPVLTIDSGDRVRVWTTTGNPKYFENLGVPKEKIPAELYAAFEGVQDAERGDHTLIGPMYVNGAEPGDTLEIRILSVDVWLPIAAQSFRPHRGVLPEDFPYAKDKVLWIDLNKKTVELDPGVVVPVKPFWGDIGVAPPREMGRIVAGPPNVNGGNMDNHDLGAGSTLYLPVHVPGAMLSLSDGHALQGDGEVCLSAVETSLKGEIQVIVHKGKRIGWPRAETPTHYMTMGFDEDLNQAAKIATREMLNFIVEEKGLSREDAYMLLSATMDLVVTQAVDDVKGIHALVPKSIFQK